MGDVQSDNEILHMLEPEFTLAIHQSPVQLPQDLLDLEDDGPAPPPLQSAVIVEALSSDDGQSVQLPQDSLDLSDNEPAPPPMQSAATVEVLSSDDDHTEDDQSVQLPQDPLIDDPLQLPHDDTEPSIESAATGEILLQVFTVHNSAPRRSNTIWNRRTMGPEPQSIMQRHITSYDDCK